MGGRPGHRARQLAEDSRGIVAPATLARTVSLQRYPVPEPLDGLVSVFWAVRWELPDGVEHRQAVLTHPCVNITVGSDEQVPERIEAGVYGVSRELTVRVLRRSGWTVAAMTRPGGIGPLLSRPAQDFTDRVAGTGEALGIDDDVLVGAVTTVDDEPGRIRVLADALTARLDRADPERVAAARDVVDAAGLAETDRTIRRVEQLADAAGVSVRTLQRMFREHAGISPAWVLRRYRLLDAAERVRNGEAVSWSEVAQELGFSDQAHLVRDFRAAIGETPEAYARAQRG